jgi:hypothetical protein
MAEVERQERDASVVAQYFEGKTLVEVAEEHNLSDERIRQILLEQGYSTRSPGKQKVTRLKFKPTARDRFCKRVVVQNEEPKCWIWTSKTQVRPRFSYTHGGEKITEYANRASRWFFLGIRDTRRLRSVCKNVKCVHPLHWLPK